MVYRVKEYHSPDITWNFAAVMILAVFEIDACIMVGCFPLFKIYFHQGKIFSSLESMTSRLFGSLRSKLDSKDFKSSGSNGLDQAYGSKSVAELYTSRTAPSRYELRTSGSDEESIKSSQGSSELDTDGLVIIRTEIEHQTLPHYASGDVEKG